MPVDTAGLRWFSDALPQTFTDLVAALDSGVERCALFSDGDEVAGGDWLHDMVDDDPEDPAYAGLRAYISPDYRGHFLAEVWPVACATVEQWGYCHLFAASHVDHQGAIAALTQVLTCTLVEDYPHFCFFDGQPGACTVCSVRAEDAGLARRDA